MALLYISLSFSSFNVSHKLFFFFLILNINFIKPKWKSYRLRVRLFCFVFFFFFWAEIFDFSCVTVHGVHYSRTHKFYFLANFLLKMGPTVLFTHLKIILLQYFSIFNFSFQFSAVSKQSLHHLTLGLQSLVEYPPPKCHSQLWTWHILPGAKLQCCSFYACGTPPTQ